MLMGNLTRDPRIRQVASGVAVTDMGLATSEVYKNKDGEQVESTCFVDIVAWGRQAETCARYLCKGAPVFVEGRLQFDQWEAQDGGRRTKLRVRANRVQFLGKPRGAESGAQATIREDNDAPMPF
jgi:single-strand DNA-binding protein